MASNVEGLRHLPRTHTQNRQSPKVENGFQRGRVTTPLSTGSSEPRRPCRKWLPTWKGYDYFELSWLLPPVTSKMASNVEGLRPRAVKTTKPFSSSKMASNVEGLRLCTVPKCRRQKVENGFQRGRVTTLATPLRFYNSVENGFQRGRVTTNLSSNPSSLNQRVENGFQRGRVTTNRMIRLA